MMDLTKLYDRARRDVENFELDSLKEFGLDRMYENYHLADDPYPPLLAMQKPSDGDADYLITNLKQPLDLYIHFPFCQAVGSFECTFCPFFKTSYDSELEDIFIDACIKELKMYKQKLGKMDVRSIYFGGGTVSLCTLPNLKRLMSFIHEELNIDSSAEIKFEIHAAACKDPDLLRAQLALLKEYRVTHICIDIQSFNAETLRAITWGRLSPEDYFNTFDICIAEGFEKFVTALIVGLPFDSFTSVLNSNVFLATTPQIVTINNYDLQLIQGNAIYKQYQRAPEIFPDVAERDIINHANRILLGSFGFYESPIYFQNRGAIPTHETKTFMRNTLLGIGPSAFGLFYGNSIAQYYNVPNVKKYVDLINEDTFPLWRIGRLSDEGWATRCCIISGLNLNKPFDMKEFTEPLRNKFLPLVEFFAKLGLLKIENGSFSPTKKGLLRLQEMSYFFTEKYVQDALHNSEWQGSLSRYNYYIKRTPEQKKMFHKAFGKYARCQ